jgi:hypothetical protein
VRRVFRRELRRLRVFVGNPRAKRSRSREMSFPTVAEFEAALQTEPLDELAKTHILEGLPFVFRDAPDSLTRLQDHLVGALGVEASDIRIIGSARIGFSLDPTNFPRPFGPSSDLDIVIVNAELFDVVWHTMLRWHYPRRTQRLPDVDWRWSIARQRELYWGWFRPEAIRYRGLSRLPMLGPIQTLSTEWFNAFQSLSTHPDLAPYQASGRLYRSWEHVLMYHVDGLRQLRDIVNQAGGSRGVQ